jgi:uncharacterized membrane protein YGL010W
MGRSQLDPWFERYGESHRHPLNRALHALCVPLITIAVVALLWRMPVPGTPLNIGLITLCAGVVSCAFVSLRHAIGLATLALLVAFLWPRIALLIGTAQLFWILALAWVGQFIGHAVEGRRPSFSDDLRFLLVGPLWIIEGCYRRIGL